MTNDEQLLAAALRYAARGWEVFPLKGKKPYPESRGFLDATTDRIQIREWWKEYPKANIGIACNSQHGPIVIDVDDPKLGETDGWRLIKKLHLANTREASSGHRHKRHLYYAPAQDQVEVKRTIRIRKDGRKYALDVLGDGGYVVAPPSIHPLTGRRYRWENERPLRPFPQQLIDLLGEVEDKSKQLAPPMPAVIGEGERDNMLTSLAGTMRRRGASEAAIFAALKEENETRVDPPLPDRDLKRIAKSIGRKSPQIHSEHFTDLGNARRFITQHEGTVRAIMAYRRPWLMWDGQRWTPDTTGEVERLAKQTVRRIYLEANHVTDEEKRDEIIKHASKSEGSQRIRSMLELAATEPELSTTPDMLDSNPWFLNVENGTIDLRTGTLRPHRREDLITKLAPVKYNPNAKAVLWNKFLLEIMSGDNELVTFLQRAVGYALTGDTREECLFFCYGQGSNGKSTFLETLRSLLGEYARQTDFNTFLSNKYESGPRNDIARLRGARLVTASEADTDKGFDSRLIKMLTGSDTVTARKLYEEHTEFKPQHKLFLAANHKPIVKEQTEGFWRRIRLIPFTAVFTAEKRDKRLPKKLLTELPGILNWAIAGCVEWRKSGLHEPAAVRKATRQYRDENDILGEFLVTSCKIDPNSWVSTAILYQAFTDWWIETRGTGQRPVSMGWFTRLLAERPEFKPVKRKHVRGWRGIALKVSMT